MVPDPLTLDDWRARLERHRHRVFEPTWETATGFTVSPDANTRVTVAVEPDGVLYPQFRQRFFLCHPEPEQVFHVLGCPKPHRTRWLELVARQPPGYWQDFIAGPGSWLLCRLVRSREVVVWSDGGMPWDRLDCSLHRGWGMVVPAEVAPLFAATAGPESIRPRLIRLRDERFADVVAACLLFASVGMLDCFLACGEGAEVYLAHHHDEVVVSVPDPKAREALLRELAEAPWLFTDVSGYGSSTDEDTEDDVDGA